MQRLVVELTSGYLWQYLHDLRQFSLNQTAIVSELRPGAGTVAQRQHTWFDDDPVLAFHPVLRGIPLGIPGPDSLPDDRLTAGRRPHRPVRQLETVTNDWKALGCLTWRQWGPTPPIVSSVSGHRLSGDLDVDLGDRGWNVVSLIGPAIRPGSFPRPGETGAPHSGKSPNPTCLTPCTLATSSGGSVARLPPEVFPG